MNNNLPAQVKKQSADVQALYQEMGVGEDPKAEAAKPGGKGKGAEEATKTDETMTASPAKKERKEAGKSDNEDEGDFKQKYLTLQGMYNTDMPKLRTQNKDLLDRLSNMELLIAGMGSESTAPAPVAKTGSVITEEDMNQYGDSIEVMRRVTQEEMQPIMQQLNSLKKALDKMTNEVMPKVDRVVTSHANTAEQNFWATVNAEVPNWKEVNIHPDFATWLNGTDRTSGQVRQDLLDDAQGKGDARRVVFIFKSWIEETGYDGGSGTETAHAAGNAELERQVAPGKGRHAEHKGEAEEASFTRLEVKNFYEDCRKGKFKGRDAERKKIEADIYKANKDGRIVN